MRILHLVTQYERGGAQWNTILSAEDALRRGHECWVAGSRGILVPDARERLGARAIVLGEHFTGYLVPGVPAEADRRVAFTPPPMAREISPVSDLRAIHGVKRLIRTLRPDIVHTHSSKAGIIGRLAARQSNVPIVVHTVHGWGFHPGQPAILRRALIEAERAAARITDRLIVVADANREKGLAAGIGSRDMYVTIRSGIAPPSADEPGRRSAVRASLGVPEGVPVAIWVGNFKSQKAPLDMAFVALEAVAAIADLRVLVVGDGSLRREVEKILGQAQAAPGASGRVHLLGWRDDVPALMAASDLLFHTARHEGLPRVILEARSRGLPIVSTNVDGIPEALGPGASAVLVEPGDISGLVAGVVSSFRGAPSWRSQSRASACRLPEEFTLSRMLDDLDALYRSLLPR